ncbi:putative non-specific serine/threonine protein kinase [Helianthus annuus]|nr:putative non-specific serine/threonine protein kinase [Helianthus annuus]
MTDTLIEAIDPHLGSDFEEEEIKRLMAVGLWCVHPRSELRPSMRQVIQVLNFEASLPVLPSTMPVASHISSGYAVASIINKHSTSTLYNTI